MGEKFSILNALLQSVFTGFGIVMPIVALLRTSNLKTLSFKEAFVLTGVQVLRITGILYFILFCVDAYLQYNTSSANAGTVSVVPPMFGPYWFYYWFSPLMYLLLSQLFWIKKLYMKKAALITLSIMLLIFPSQRLLIILTTFQRDYLPSNWTMYQGNIALQVLLNIIVFIFTIFTVMIATGKLKKLSE